MSERKEMLVIGMDGGSVCFVTEVVWLLLSSLETCFKSFLLATRIYQYTNLSLTI